MAVKLHRCSNQWVKIKAHPCWKVEKALMDMGIEYERVPGPLGRSKADGGVRGHGTAHVPGHPVRGRHLVPRGVEGHGADDPRGSAHGEARLDFSAAGL